MIFRLLAGTGRVGIDFLIGKAGIETSMPDTGTEKPDTETSKPDIATAKLDTDFLLVKVDTAFPWEYILGTAKVEIPDLAAPLLKEAEAQEQ